ncbi:hypothetical protein TNCV_1854091 [Trichonephila clavipes]|nr:hypothetical protein TNCV_1854091 [Trichonephila clavipes]
MCYLSILWNGNSVASMEDMCKRWHRDGRVRRTTPEPLVPNWYPCSNFNTPPTGGLRAPTVDHPVCHSLDTESLDVYPPTSKFLYQWERTLKNTGTIVSQTSKYP